MKLKEAYEAYKKFKVPSLSEIRDIASEHSKTSLVIIILLVLLLLMALQYIPHYQVSQFNITNQKDLADAENSYRATLAQILGGVAIGIGIYYTWRRITIAEEDLKATQENLKVTQENLKVSQKGQITERFTRAIDLLGATDKNGNPAIEIRLGGIYALEKIADKSEEYYWPIVEILTAYVRKNSEVQATERKEFKNISMDTLSPIKVKTQKIKELPFDILAIVTVINRRKHSLDSGENVAIDLSFTNLEYAQFPSVNFNNAYFNGANLTRANLNEAKLSGIIFYDANLSGADFSEADLTKADLSEAISHYTFFHGSNLTDTDLTWADLNCAYFIGANLTGANLTGVDFTGATLKESLFVNSILKGANFEEANLENADFEGADLRGAKNLTAEQLSKVYTLYTAELDEGLEAELRGKSFGHLLDDEPE